MGAPRDEPFIGATSDIQVEVWLTHEFEIGQTEVTRSQWLAAGLPDPEVDWRKTGGPSRDEPPEGYSLCEEPECPVLWVGYEDAMAYANLLSEAAGLRPCYLLSDCERSPGKDMRCHSVRVDAESPYACDGYRLPTEAEWEYAARAGTKTAFYSGEILADENIADHCGLDPNLDRIGWYCGNSGGTPGHASGHAHPVAQKEPNAWGLYDCSGNAYEWVNDLYNPEGYGESPRVDPVGGVREPNDLTPARHPVLGDYLSNDGFPGFRVLRGGSHDLWSYTAKSDKHTDGEGSFQSSGFRIARTILGAKP